MSSDLSTSRIATAITVSLHLANQTTTDTRQQPKVDKTPNGYIIDLVTFAIREMTSHHAIESDFQKFPVIFPVLRENGTVRGTARLRMIGGDDAGMPLYHICAIP
jgi:hypothetical protein